MLLMRLIAVGDVVLLFQVVSLVSFGLRFGLRGALTGVQPSSDRWNQENQRAIVVQTELFCHYCQNLCC